MIGRQSRARAQVGTWAIFVMLVSGALPPAAAHPGWYLSIDRGVNILNDSTNESRAPDSFDPGQPGSCAAEVPGLLCIAPTEGEPPTVTPGAQTTSVTRFATGDLLRLSVGRAFELGFRPELTAHFRENEFDSLTLGQGYGEAEGTRFDQVPGRTRQYGAQANLWYDWNVYGRIRPTLGAGIGFARTELDDADSSNDGSSDGTDTTFTFQAGAGVAIRLTPLLAFTADARYLESDLPEFRTADGQPVRTEYTAQSLTVGLRYVFRPADPLDTDKDSVADYRDHCPGTTFNEQVDTRGCELDSDGDGVIDSKDQCPNTPPGMSSNIVGCPEDRDADHVLDYEDLCPNTPPGTPVDATGCPYDADFDGVSDADDRCPGTPAGLDVDSRGCAVDSDRDGVGDIQDKCPGTAPGAEVDERGCPQDSDGDSVTDDRDECPGTPAGAAVMANGCAVGQSQVLYGVSFEMASARLDSNSAQLLEATAETLRNSPNFRIQIQGHTCDLGSADYNLRLSQQRADSVRKFLLDNGVSSSQLEARGYGETRPKVPNSSEANREKNRRVELMVLQR